MRMSIFMTVSRVMNVHVKFLWGLMPHAFDLVQDYNANMIKLSADGQGSVPFYQDCIYLPDDQVSPHCPNVSLRVYMEQAGSLSSRTRNNEGLAPTIYSGAVVAFFSDPFFNPRESLVLRILQ
jgi:hypothetical protein